MSDFARKENFGTFVDTKRAASYLGLKPHTLEVYRQNGEGPAFYKLGRLCKYKPSDLAAWAEARKRTSTSDTGEG